MLWLFPSSLTLIGVIGLLINQNNLLLIFLSLEVILVGINLNFWFFSIINSNLGGQLISLVILTLAAAEASLGLAILLAYFRLRGSISIATSNLLRP